MQELDAMQFANISTTNKRLAVNLGILGDASTVEYTPHHLVLMIASKIGIAQMWKQNSRGVPSSDAENLALQHQRWERCEGGLPLD